MTNKPQLISSIAAEMSTEDALRSAYAILTEGIEWDAFETRSESQRDKLQQAADDLHALISSIEVDEANYRLRKEEMDARARG